MTKGPRIREGPSHWWVVRGSRSDHSFRGSITVIITRFLFRRHAIPFLGDSSLHMRGSLALNARQSRHRAARRASHSYSGCKGALGGMAGSLRRASPPEPSGRDRPVRPNLSLWIGSFNLRLGRGYSPTVALALPACANVAKPSAAQIVARRGRRAAGPLLCDLESHLAAGSSR